MERYWNLIKLVMLPVMSIALVATWGESLSAKEPHRYYTPTAPQNDEDMAKVKFFLLTGGVGDEIANRFGHTGIRIVDPLQGTDVVFNWGKFSFDAPGFAWKFFRGSLTYSMGVRTFTDDMEIYHTTGRRLVMEPINFSTAQKRRLYDKIAWNAQPQNREFAYQYWYKNCSTIPRDLFNDVFLGKLKPLLASQNSGKVFRDYVISNLAAMPFIVPLLDTLMNGNIDHPINKWEEMFLPAKLREHLLSAQEFDETGQIILGTSLLGPTAVLVDNVETFAAPFNDYACLAAPLWLGLTLCWVFGFWQKSQKLSPKRTSTNMLSAGMHLRILGCGICYFGILFGLVGSTLLINWFLSGHPDGWANVNLAYIWPTDWVFAIVGWKLLATGQPIKDRWPFAGAGLGYFVAKCCGFFALILLHALGYVGQDIHRIVLWFGIPGVSLLLTFCMIARVTSPQKALQPWAAGPWPLRHKAGKNSQQESPLTNS